eukprot:TRINITY_DN37896_c0_g1_i1.p1 TRINITY_DN37896_c0_g1~~TRINITY_DN37896_c0_g1_i1.p1  ORF type:complete len:108 (+),score=5.42 TRINITY_DN37896_c0_g1_i1:4-327(+)
MPFSHGTCAILSRCVPSEAEVCGEHNSKDTPATGKSLVGRELQRGFGHRSMKSVFAFGLLSCAVAGESPEISGSPSLLSLESLQARKLATLECKPEMPSMLNVHFCC